ncbi:MAG: type 2 isopentenyl-diphosphate Delta-isomerase, partial [Promethearchaeota archaeon]
KDFEKIISYSIDIIETAIDLGIIPVLYGDIVLDKYSSFSIISGDQIILELCKNIKKYVIEKVIFAIEKDGIFIKDEINHKIKLATNIDADNLEKIELANLEQKIDVTGGIRSKLKYIKKICKLEIPVQLINGLIKGNINKALKSKKFICTNIKPFKKKSIDDIKERKLEHLKIPLKHDVQYSKNYFKYVKLIHHPLPEINLEEIDLSTTFFNKKISAPICISAMTGGHPLSKKINEILAKAAEKENIIMSVGSQRAALSDPSIVDSFNIVRDVAPNIPIIGNIGIGQISTSDFKIESFNKCIEMIKADAMAIHFNPLHELVQNKGDLSYKLFIENFKKIRDNTNIPIIAKEVGAGLNKDFVQKMDSLGFDGFDIGGAGGTSFAAIELYRNSYNDVNYSRNLAEIFREWGIPTPISIFYVRNVSQKLIIATGGLRTGMDIAKSIVLGADIGGFAYKFLISSMKDYKERSIANTIKEIKTLKNELRSCLWLINIDCIKKLKSNKEKRVLLGKLRQWISS